MASNKGRFVRLISGLVLDQVTVVSVREIGGFQRVQLHCNGRKFGDKLTAGAKVQLLLPDNEMRTYTPIRSPGGMLLLGWTHAGGPGAHWLARARPGDSLPVVGPQRSLELEAPSAIIVGDETSVAVAATFALERPGKVHAIIQSDAARDTRSAGVAVGLHDLTVVGRADTAATVDAITAKLAGMQDVVVALTGGSELVVAVREGLRGANVGAVKTKTYWIPGRVGLD